PFGTLHTGVGGEHRWRDCHGGVARRRLPPPRELFRSAVVDLRPARLRASLAVIVIGTAYVLLNMLRPARPEPAVASAADLARARALIASADVTLANAALTGDKRLLF